MGALVSRGSAWHGSCEDARERQANPKAVFFAYPCSLATLRKIFENQPS